MSVIENGLWKAADVLREGGWIKNHLVAGASHCAIGAYVAGYGNDFASTSNASNWAESNHPDEVKAVANTIRELFPERSRNSSTDTGLMVTFNDNPDTTEEDVVKVFRVAAVKLAAGI